jgi:glycosyltransferase involved in cell wall biosynthesis
MSRVLVSIIIPCYNGEKHIAKAIESCLNQTYRNIEIIIVDDGSSDSSSAIIKGIKDNRIKYFYQDNCGSPLAKNNGLRQAKGEYIQFLDCDDYLSRNKISSQLQSLKKSTKSITVCRTKIFYEDEDLLSDKLAEIDTNYLTFSNNPKDFLFNLMGINGRIGMVQPNAFLIPRDVIDKAGYWSEALDRSPDDDSEFMCRVILNSEEIIYNPNSINYYRKSWNELSSSKKEINAKGALKTINLKSDYILSINDTQNIRNVIAKHYAVFAYVYCRYHISLLETAINQIHNLGITKIPVKGVGGNLFQLIRRFLGFRFSIHIIYHLNNISSKFKKAKK